MVLAALFGCKGEPEEACTRELGAVWYADDDRDGFGDPDDYLLTCDGVPEARVLNADDCNDRAATVFPLAPERCDGLDNDCDGSVDEGLPFFTWFADVDGDGWGAGPGVSACRAPAGSVRESGDCDDAAPTVHPTADETCDGLDNDCDGLPDDADPMLSPFGAGAYHPDGDGDGFGDSTSVVFACEQPPGLLTDATDCNDASASVFPGAPEVCDNVDNDCNLLIDTFDPNLDSSSLPTFYLDADLDGFGDPNITVLACFPFGSYVSDGTDCDDSRPEVLGPATTDWLEDVDGDGVGAGVPALTGCVPPTPDWIGTWIGIDCDDSNPAVSPLEVEVCDGLDNNCSTLIDDDDPALSLSTGQSFMVDFDEDGFGGPPKQWCEDPGNTAAIGGDCDDEDPEVNPAALEVCNDGVDDDCSGLADDDDPLLDPTSAGFFIDADGDGYGDSSLPVAACTEAVGRADNPDDCDDTDPLIIADTLWWPDTDGDGFGAGATVGPECTSPILNGAPIDIGEDCDDTLGFIFPGASDLCGDGIDQDCDGMDRPCPRTDCAAILAEGLSTGDGVYTIDPSGTGNRDVWCDMTTDGGGWTLVSSSAFPVDDAADVYSSNLATLSPLTFMNGVWDGLRPVIPANSDIRFTCKFDPVDTDFEVDLVFYDIHWYRELTSGTEEEVCFNEDNGLGFDAPGPERLNVLTGQVRELGNPWNDAGYLEGEDSCASPDDFTVDFDDRGMDSNQFDGTDWGEDDSLVKCGITNFGASWFIFVR